jgi:hypothetical protein
MLHLLFQLYSTSPEKLNGRISPYRNPIYRIISGQFGIVSEKVNECNRIKNRFIFIKKYSIMHIGGLNGIP